VKSDARALLRAASVAGENNIKVAGVADFSAGQSVMIDTGAEQETAVIQTVGTAGATTVRTATEVGATVIPVAMGMGFTPGPTITIDDGARLETAVVAAAGFFGRAGAVITVAKLLGMAHAAGVQVSGTGSTLAAALTKTHANGPQVARSR
jgi:non-reducing end alpha-L-arabinofuranosidase